MTKQQQNFTLQQGKTLWQESSELKLINIDVPKLAFPCLHLSSLMPYTHPKIKMHVCQQGTDNMSFLPLWPLETLLSIDFSNPARDSLLTPHRFNWLYVCSHTAENVTQVRRPDLFFFLPPEARLISTLRKLSMCMNFSCIFCFLSWVFFAWCYLFFHPLRQIKDRVYLHEPHCPSALCSLPTHTHSHTSLPVFHAVNCCKRPVEGRCF